MKIVIDIPDNEYYIIKEMNLTLHTEMLKGSIKDWENASTILNLLESVKSGTVIPKGYGDLIDRKELLSHTKCTYKYDCPSGSSCDKCSDNCVEVRDIENAPIVIEADKDDNHE